MRNPHYAMDHSQSATPPAPASGGIRYDAHFVHCYGQFGGLSI